MDYNTLKYEVADGILTLTLNRPDHMNAFTVEKIRSNYLLEHLRHLRQEEQMLASNEASLSSRDAKRLDQLRKDIAECEAYDLDLKDVADRQIAFDLDDGVTENHKLFGNVVAKIK